MRGTPVITIIISVVVHLNDFWYKTKGIQAMIDSPHSRDLSERGAARAEDAHGTPTQSHISPGILVYADNVFVWVGGAHETERSSSSVLCGSGCNLWLNVLYGTVNVLYGALNVLYGALKILYGCIVWGGGAHETERSSPPPPPFP